MTRAATVATRGPWVMPDARMLLPADAPRERWLAERRNGLGGSDASTVAGVNRWSSRYQLWLDKTGRLPEKETSARMEAGQRIEPVLRSWFTDQTGISIRRQGLVVSRQRPFQMVSLDGLTEDGGIFEAKTLGWRVAEEWDDGQVADHAEVQIQHALAVTGRSHGWAAALIDGWDFQIRRIERNDKLIELITSMEDEFWREHVLADVPPPMEPNALDIVKGRWPDASGDTAACSPAEWEPLRDEYRAAAAVVKDAQARKDTAEAAIRALFGAAATLTVLGEPVATCKQITTNRLDSKQLRVDNPELADRYTTTSSHRRLALQKAK